MWREDVSNFEEVEKEFIEAGPKSGGDVSLAL
jgi:hypothetical protein